MMRWQRMVCLVLLAALVLPGAGCLSNGQCSSLPTVLFKLGTDYNIGSLTACEWQTVFSELPTLASTAGIDLQGTTIPALTDAQAQAIVDFLQAQKITTVDELITAYESGKFTSSTLPADLQTLMNAFLGS